MAALEALNEAVVDCRRCPRLVEWREQVAREKRAAYRDWDYWGRPMQGFGDPAARILILGLAPAAHGGNRTGRIFTGDRSGDFLFASLHRVGLANQAGVDRARRRAARCDGAYIVAAVRCAPPANLPTPEERANCSEWLEREVALLPEVHVVVCLGGFAWESALRLRADARRRADAAPEAEVRPRRRRRRRAVAAARLLSPEPAEHVHRQADAGDDGRRASRRRASWPGAREALRRHPALAATSARSSPRRCSRGCRSASTRWRSSSTCASRPGSFAIAGAVSGTLAAGSAFGAPVQGRLVDRIGARRVLVPLAFVHAVALGAIVGFAELGAPTVVLILCGFIAGFAIPPTSSVLRSMWTDLLEPRLHQAAYALDSTMIELIFISGPLLTAAIAAVTSPAGALIVSAIAVVAGTTIFTALPPTRHVEPEEHEHQAACSARSPRPACARSC